ncbi:sterile alpha motif domain-containing protein 9-like [Mercenaria mercenaria]|uniref:sterile alpha motif domain-containing protein 9-like n=1 Tax=Mercenaria mercenaria TaxID=6596 RepID=UPI00234F2B61|nr:sterile alpha motif domain-containing protein 9-like [Mercenaria mercenaria]
MAHIVKIPQYEKRNRQKTQHFYKTLDLNISTGSETMRDLANSYLQKKGVRLKQHLNEPHVKQKISDYKQLSSEQFQTIHSSSPSLDKMDISLLTVLLLHTFPEQLSPDAKKSIKGLKRTRNSLAHAVKAELDDDTIFKDTLQLIMGLANEVHSKRKNYSRDLFNEINEIRLQEVVYSHCNLDRVKLNNEMYVVKLVEATDDERVDQADVWRIKIGLTKWVRQLSRGVVVSALLQALKEEGVINDTTKRQIEEEYSNEEQMQLLVLHMMDETKLNLYKFCQCLRQLSSIMADLVENSNTDGRDVEQYLKSYEKENVTRILGEHFVESEDGTVTTESLHIFVEEQFGFAMAFSTVEKFVHAIFPDVKRTTSFIGLSWKEETTEPAADAKEPTDESLSGMTCESFAVFVGDWFAEIDKRLTIPLKTAIQKEIIAPKIFLEMTEADMKDVFSPYIENKDSSHETKLKYGFGIKSGLMQIQRKIRKQNVAVETDRLEILRPFDSPFGRTSYKQCQVRPHQGNLLIPAHEFRPLPSRKKFKKHFVVKEVIRFTAACINGRKNGTIHFGIEPLGNGVGHINGVPEGNRWQSLNIEIGKAINVCFKENASIAFKCVRPVQLINVEGGGIVIEVDVVPFSKYISRTLLSIDFPPKGNQHQECYVYSLKPDFGILSVNEEGLKETEEFYEMVLQERIKLEVFNDKKLDRTTLLVQQLRKMLTGGNTYVTDAFIPVIVSGKISGIPDELETRAHMKEMAMAFTSSAFVIDCDDSVLLRKDVEGNKRIFHVKTAEDLVTQNEISETSPTWLYCNGNNELSKEAMEIENWIDNRAEGVRKAFEKLKNIIPKSRAKIIFLVFQSNKAENDLLREIARMAFVTYFKNKCVILAEQDDDVSFVRKELETLIGHQRLENSFHTGLRWKHISRLMKNIFKLNPATVCKLPHCDGHFIEMTKMERESLNFTDIEILSGEECIDLEAQMKPDEIKSKAVEAQEQFYHGGLVSWWDFYYKHVGERDQYLLHRNEIRDKLANDKGETLIEEHEIEHHPGAGGSTLGRHLLWYFSQFRKTPEKSYRCCVIKTQNVTDETIEQIEKFRNFNDGECPKPFIVLSDNMNEENENFLKAKLYEAAYKTGYPGKLFCLVIIICRRPITYEETDGKPLLKHSLSKQEQVWFEEKFKQMEKNDVDVETLIAFNFMRHSFDPGYMQKTVDHLLKGVTRKEMKVLRCLALVRSYESDCLVPESVFDTLMDAILVDIRSPWGIIHSLPELQRLATVRNEPWNTQISRAMSLIIVKRNGHDFYNSGVCLISQMLARIVLEYIQEHESVSLENIVDHVLDLVETQTSETNPMSKRFVRIICSLFKTRQLLEGEGPEQKQKFSDLVLKLELQDTSESENDARQRVIRTMTRCFGITKDHLVGQQLARFNIHIKEYSAAEEAIKQSLQIQSQNSYLLHTYGQIFKTKMEGMLANAAQTKTKVRDAEAAEIIDLAFQAIEKFVSGQRIAISTGEHTTWGCFHTEVKTALSLLEKFQHFACYTTRQAFISFLNNDILKVADGPLLRMMKKCPALENLRAGSAAQCHLETSLRSMEERSYQVKRQLYVIYSEDETLLLGLRERFERFYGSQKSTSKYQFSFGIGLKPLMVAKVRNNQALCRRVKEAKEHLEQVSRQQVDERDLLVYLGDKIITISRQGPQDVLACSFEEYKRLLSYSTDLVAVQTIAPASKSKRLYLETFLYFAMLHWPLKTRTKLDIDAISRPAAYGQIIKTWEESYNNNFYIKTREQYQRYRPKNYFALGKGEPGNDIVDLESIKREWMDRKKKATGRVRKPVFKDFFWRESFVEERLERLEGVVDDSGNNITHEAEYPQGYHKFRIRTYYPCPDLSNRSVTFVLGFTWKEPTAFDVLEIGKSRNILPDGDKPISASCNADNKANTGNGDLAENDTRILYERTQQTDQESNTDKSKPRRRRKKHVRKQ